jgi:PAS domain S-box-containing protein
MPAEELARSVARFEGSHAIVIRSWQRSADAGLTCDETPSFRRISSEELAQRQAASSILLAAAIPHLRWLSRWFDPRPHVVYVVDADGIVLHAEGDAGAIARFGLSPGHDWSESQMGTNGAGTALAAGAPVAVVGCDHWSTAWKDATCLGAPLFAPDGSRVGAIDISMDVQPGDADRLVVVAHVAYTICQELARRQAEVENRAGQQQHALMQAALEAERRARADAELALWRQHEAEAALRESEARLSLAVEKAGMGMWQLDLLTKRCTWSPGTAALFGLPPGEQAGTLEKFLDLVHPDDREAIRRAKDAAAEGATYDVDFRTTWPDGSVHWINGKGRVAPGADGVGLRLLGIGRDVTGPRQLNDTLRESEQRFRLMANTSPVMIWVTDAEGTVEFVNRAYCEFFGVSEGDVARPGGWQPLVHPDDAETYVTAFLKSLQDRTPFFAEVRVLRADGQWRWIASYAAPRFTTDGRFLGAVGSSPDVTEMKAAIAEAREASRSKDTFLATVAHELRQPLTAIQAALGVMQMRSSPELGHRARAVVDRQVRQLSRLVEDLLDAARIKQGKLELRRERLRLHDVLEAAIAVVQPLMREREQHFTIHGSDTPAWIDGDPARLQQVFSNLLMNASKFTDRGGSVGVLVDSADGTVIVRIHDTGRGIAPEMLSQVFQLFTQAEHNDLGLGIGLAVVHGLVHAHGGTVEARSDGPGRGSEFTVWLPAAAIQG